MVKLIDVVLEGAKAVVQWVIDLFLEGLRSGYETLSIAWFGTPTPETDGAFIFGTPTNAPWPAIHDALVGGEITLLALLVLLLCVQGRHVIRIFNIGSGYQARKTTKTAWLGAILIITWYWIGVTVLFLVDGFTIALLPDVSALVDMLQGFTYSLPSNTGLTLLFSLLGGLAMWIFEALLYIREVLLYAYLYGMPIAIALAYGNLPLISQIASRFCQQFIPLAVLPLPAAIVFKGYDLLYASGTPLDPTTAFLKTLIAVSLPLLALYATWKTFSYAAPLTAKTIGSATKGSALVGGVAAGAYLGSAGVATTAARWGPKAAAGHAVAQRATAGSASNQSNEQSTEQSPTGTETNREQQTPWKPAYRRTENDRGIY